MMGTIDPIKLLKKYKWALVVATIFGAMLGTASHVAFKMFYPIWIPDVIFQCSSPKTDIGNPGAIDVRSSEEELRRFMETQSQFMVSNRVFYQTVRDPRLERESPHWAQRFMSGGIINDNDAVIELQDTVRARVIPNTNYIQLRVRWKNKEEATGLVGLLKKAYLDELRKQASGESGAQRQMLVDMIEQLETEFEQLQQQREFLLDEHGIDSVDERLNQAFMLSQTLTEQLAILKMEMEAARVLLSQFEDQLHSPAGVITSAQQEELVNNDLIIKGLEQQIASFEASYMANQEAGLGAEHRDQKRAKTTISGLKRKRDEMRQTRLRELLDAQIDQARTAIAQFEAQETQLMESLETNQARRNDLVSIQTTINDIDMQIEGKITALAERESQLGNLRGLINMSTTDRVMVFQGEQIPEQMAFPKIYIMIPVGTIFIVGLVGGVIVLREVLDQRVKGPADIMLIPRTRVAGLIPHVSEDPTNPPAVEKAVSTNELGVVAEGFRKVRSPLLKRMQRAGHKTLLVISGMPGSGGTTVVSNLALACAAGEQKVLVIDANFRRPKLHSIFEIEAGAGLGDVLAGDTDLASAVCSAQGGVDVLTAGSPNKRRFERLGTNAMTDLLEQAKAEYDVVLIDVAPAIVSGDAFALANRCDATMLVVRAYSEKRGLVARIKGDLSETPAEFMGVLVNAVRSSAGGYFRRNIKATHEYQSEVAA